MERIYMGFVHEEKGKYWMDFPDLPGCFTQGDNLEELAINAKEAAALYLDGQEAPTASKISAQSLKKENAQMLLAVPVEIEEKAVRINITVPKNFLKMIDSYVSHNSELNRSSLFVQAAMSEINPNKKMVAKTKVKRKMSLGNFAKA